MKSIFVPLSLLLVTACASTNVMPLSSVHLPAKPEDCELDIYTDASRVKGPYKELALITHSTKPDAFSDKSAGPIIEEMSKEACSLGADALIVRAALQGSWGNPGSGEAIAIKMQ